LTIADGSMDFRSQRWWTHELYYRFRL